MALISGVKGSGKTTLLKSLQEMFEKPKTVSNSAPGLTTEESAALEKLSGELNRTDRELERIVWLKPLPLDPLRPGTNLAAAIFARIQTGTGQRVHETRRQAGLLDHMSEFDRARHEFENLQSHAVNALEGNLGVRTSGMDPDTYSVTASDNERQRLSIGDKLNDVLGRIMAPPGSQPKEIKSLFVLPIDDMDVRPSRAVDALQLATLLSVPRLFFLFLGSIETLDQVLFFQTQAELFSLFPGGHGAEGATEDIIARANETAWVIDTPGSISRSGARRAPWPCSSDAFPGFLACSGESISAPMNSESPCGSWPRCAAT